MVGQVIEVTKKVDRIMRDAAFDREIERGGKKNTTINHRCGGSDCGSGGNSDSNIDGDSGSDGGSKGIEDYDDNGGDDGVGGARTTARASKATAAVAAAGALTFASVGQRQRWRRRGR